jgi:type III secretory pathway component EscS
MLGLADLIAQAIRDGKAAVRAEVDLVKARFADRFRRARTGIILIVIALVIAHAAMIGLVVGLVMGLASLVGATLAGVIVLVVGLLVAGILGWIAASLLSRPSPEARP